MTRRKFQLSMADIDVLIEAIDDSLDIAEGTLECHIVEDHVQVESLEEFLGLVGIQQERKVRLEALRKKLEGVREQ